MICKCNSATFGGAYSTDGTGSTTSDGFSITYHYPDVIYRNDFHRTTEGWRWTIVEQPNGKPERLFAEYLLQQTTCRGMKFNF